MSKAYDRLQLCHLNARSLSKTKLDYLSFILPTHGIDVICITETWFNADMDDVQYNLENYSLLRHDRLKGLEEVESLFTIKKR